MEFDLNTEIAEVEEEENDNGRARIEKGRLGISPSSSSSCSSGSSSFSTGSASSIYSELWHACAGPLTSLPKKGNVVVYFPQGHLEQDAMVSYSSPLEIPKFDLNPQIFCRVVNVQLLVSLSVSLPKKNHSFCVSFAILEQVLFFFLIVVIVCKFGSFFCGEQG